MENKNEQIRENGMLVLLALSPIVIGFFYYVMVQLPLIGTIWMYAAPFTVLYYWGWVATVFQAKFQHPAKSFLLMNSVGILMYFIYVFQVIVADGEASVFTVFAQLYTVPLGFITNWIAFFIDGSSVFASSQLSLVATIAIETAGILLMLVATVVGFYVAKQQKKKAQEVVNEKEMIKEEQIQSVFSDKELTEYELQDQQNNK